MISYTGSQTDTSDDLAHLRQHIAHLEKENVRLHQRIERDQPFFLRGPLVFFTWRCADSWPVEYVSPNVAALLGYQADDFISGRVPYGTVVHPDDLPRVAAEVQTYSAEGRETFEQEYRLIHANGDTRWIYDFTVVVRDTQGTITHYYGYILDITSRKQQEEALHMANQRIEHFLEATPLATIEFDRTGIITRWNTSAERIFGWTASEALGHDMLSMVVTPFQINEIEDIHDQTLTEQITSNRNDNLTRDGHTITCQWYNTVLYDDDGHVLSVLAQAEDITEQVRREEELRLFKTLADNAPDGIAANTMNGTISYANASYQAMHGYGADIVGISHQNLIPELAELQPALQSLREIGAWQGMITHQRRDGSTFPVMASVFTIYNEAGYPIALAAIDRDITQQQQADQERTDLQQQVIDAQQLAIQQLSAPLLPIADHIVALPLIGSIDTWRAQQIMQTLLDGIAKHRATMAIVDITGVQVVDTQVAQTLIQTAQAVKLLGAQVVLTGIQPQIAQTLVHLGIDLHGIVTRSTLQAGIAYALNERKGR